MIYSSLTTSDWRISSPEVIYLEPEHFDEAEKISLSISGESQRWQLYLNALALFAFEEWLEIYLPGKIQRKKGEINGYQIQVEQMKLWLIAREHILDEGVYLPQFLLEDPVSASHFYVLLEVSEEEELVVLQGIQRHDLLTSRSIKDTNEQLWLPLNAFDPEPNHLIQYINYLDPKAIPLPVSSLQHHKTNLSQWFRGIVEEEWQRVQMLIDYINNKRMVFGYDLRSIMEIERSGISLASSLPSSSLPSSSPTSQSRATILPETIKQGKLIHLDLRQIDPDILRSMLGSYMSSDSTTYLNLMTYLDTDQSSTIEIGYMPLALLLTVIPKVEEKVDVQAVLLPTIFRRLPKNLKFTLLSNGEELQSVIVQEESQTIERPPFIDFIKLFSSELTAGSVFTLEVRLNDFCFQEEFEI